jgi:hypothetical protein
VQLCQAKQVVGRAQSSNARGSNDFPMSAARARALGRSGGIDVQNDASGLAPIDPIALGIEKPKIGHEMFLIVRRQGVNVRCFGTSGWTCDEWRGPFYPKEVQTVMAFALRHSILHPGNERLFLPDTKS